jgi:hypothetical protein
MFIGSLVIAVSLFIDAIDRSGQLFADLVVIDEEGCGLFRD